MTLSSGEGPSGRVLYVDPDEGNAAPVVATLERAAFEVDRVADLTGARDLFGNGSYDCVVSRQELPDGTGLELLGTLRQTDGVVPFVLFPVEGDERLASEAVSAEVSDYVPCERPEEQRLALVDAVAGAIERPDERFAEVSEGLKDRAMDEAPVGITIADATRRDMPLIYANDAFTELTGYTETESLGRNCRFLQGDDTDDSSVAEMARAIDAGEPASVEVRNYTKDGEEFWNRVDIAPVYDADGRLRHYVGFQLDVTERVETEREARRQAEKATAERETVESLLARLDGLVTDVTSRLLGASTRSAVEAAVCERLSETDEYAVAWIGDRDPTRDVVVPSNWAGGDRPDEFEVAIDDGPVGRAVETGELQVVTAADAETDPAAARFVERHADAAGESIAAVSVVSLQYGDVGYGVLVVALRAGNRLSEPEQRVLSAVGRTTAMALHDLASQRLLASDEVIELEFSLSGREPFFVALSADLDAAFTHVGTVTRDGGPATLFFETDGDADAVADALDGSDIAVTPVTTGDGRPVLEFTADATPVVDLLLDRGGRITDMQASGGTGALTVEIPPEAQARAVVEAVESQLQGADLVAYREQERPAATRQDVRSEIDSRLTDRQATALRTALVGGFFEWPRESTGEELADTMDIGRSTFHQHLRAAQRKVFEELYG
ncbi:MAG: bacterio-opsin activator domain-containing protein [Haloarculaceae archaeon]